MSEVLRRWNVVVQEVLGDGGGWIVTTGGEPEQLAELGRHVGSEHVRLRSGLRAPWLEDDAPPLELFGAPLTWHPGMLDAWFLRLAMDMEINTLILDRGCHRVVAPYDGGVDVILADTKSAMRFGVDTSSGSLRTLRVCEPTGVPRVHPRRCRERPAGLETSHGVGDGQEGRPGKNQSATGHEAECRERN